MKFTIRRATHSDIPALVSGQIAMALESENLALNETTVSAGVKAVIDDENKGTYWIASTESEIAGCLLCVPEWSDWRNATVLWIHSVYTWPHYRKQGVYKALYAHLKTLVQNSSQYAGIRLYVDKKNTSAQEVYSKLGMNGEHYHLYEWLK